LSLSARAARAIARSSNSRPPDSIVIFSRLMALV